MKLQRFAGRTLAGLAMAAATLTIGGFFPAVAGAAATSAAATGTPKAAGTAKVATAVGHHATTATPSGVGTHTTSSAGKIAGAPTGGSSAPNLAPGTRGMALRAGSHPAAAPTAKAPTNKAAAPVPGPSAAGDACRSNSPPQPTCNLIQGSGPIMKNPVIYNVFWLPTGVHYESGATAAGDTSYQSLLNRWAADIGGNDYYNIVTQYPGSNGTPANSVAFGGSFLDTAAYPHAGTQADPLSDADIQAEATHAAAVKGWVSDSDHIYLVYTGFNIFQCQTGSSDCNFFKSGHTSAYCAYHFFFGSTIYSFMGNDDMSGEPGGCSNGQAPNGDAAADAEISSATHEFIESVTDPKINNWLTSAATDQQEIGDLCNRTDGPHNVLAPGADVYLNGNPYDVQEQWSNAVSGCAMDLNGAKNGIVPPALTLTKTGPATAVTGQTLNYSVTVTNPSNTDASTVTTVTDALPAGVTYKSGSANPAPDSLSPLTWNLGTLAVHDHVTITFQATSNPQSINNCAGDSWKDLLGLNSFTGGGSGGACAATTVSQAATTTVVASDHNPSVFGQPVTFKATVTVNSPGVGVPTGSVQFFDGVTPIGSGTLTATNPPTFSITTVTLSVSTHPITAVYAGDGNFLGSTSAVLNQVVNKAPTTTVVTSDHNPAVFGQPVTLTATVAANPPGAGTPTGSVQFFDGVTPIGSGTLVGGQFSIVKSNFSVATHPITAVYGGDGNFLDSTSAVVNQVVNKAPTTTTLTANPPGSVGFGHPVTFTATVAPAPPSTNPPAQPTGPVIFSVDGTPVQTVNLNPTQQASVTTSSLSPGTHVIQAAYQGDGNFLASTGTLNYTVTCTVTITGNHPGAVIASGDSTCVIGADVGGSIIVSKGTSLAVINSTVHGSINATNTPNAIEVCGSTFVGGAVSVIKAQGLVIVGDTVDAGCAVNTMSGTLVLENNTNGVEAIGNTVGGLVAFGNSGPGPFPGDVTTISGNIIAH